jgi:uncharacterized iron-regulated membrane protein
MNLDSTLLARRISLFWRVHFWAAIIASPFALIATLTGILYVFTPQIEAVLYKKLDYVTPINTVRSLDDAIGAAKLAAPTTWRLHSAVPNFSANDTIKVYFVPPASSRSITGAVQEHNHGSTQSTTNPIAVPKPSFGLPAQAITVYVNPYTAEVVGSLANKDRFNSWAKKLHSTLLQNDAWRWMIELAASWLMVMLLTGLYLWWPRKAQAFLPEANSKGRKWWKQWHSFIGVSLSVMSLIILSTGLTWSKYAGDQIRSLRDAVGQASPQVPQGLKSIITEGQAALNWQTLWDTAKAQTPDVAIQMTPPREPNGTWRIASFDRSQPEKRFDLVLDAYSGKSLYYAGWDKQTAFGKATAIGIPFHRGEFGWWNQALLLLFGFSVLFSLVSGWVMFFKRRQTGTFMLPRLLPGAWSSASVGMWFTAVALCSLMPLLAISTTAVAIFEIAIHNQPFWRMRFITKNGG